MFRWNVREHLTLGVFTVKWLLLATPMAAVVGSACALFLWALEKATELRFAQPWLLFLLPLAGVAIVATYQKVGGKSDGGNNLLMDEIHEPGGGVPRRMAPLILVATVTTHLFGGSAGREGTAVQMGGSIAAAFGRRFKLNADDMRILLMCGIAAGFGGIFGTPLTGAIFAMEVLTLGRITYEAIVPCLIAALVGDISCAAWGTHHTHYTISPESTPQLAGTMSYDVRLLPAVALAAVAFGLASVLFAELTHSLSHFWKRIKVPLLRPVAGALCVIALTYALGTRDYLGLGVVSSDPRAVTILSCFRAGGAEPFSWWWKLLLTALTLSCGFKGGEVTPLFFIGAALGNTLGTLLGAPVDLFAGLGFIAVFAGATNTPLACTIMGVELFGAHYTVYFMLACFLAYAFSGHSGIYAAQRIGIPKMAAPHLPPGVSLRQVRELEPESALWSTLWHRHRSKIDASEAGVRDAADALDAADLRDNSDRILNGTTEDDTTAIDFFDDMEGERGMSHRHRVTSKEIGQIRIYMTPGEKPNKGRGPIQRFFSGTPLYMEIIQAAKKDGMMSATAHHTHYGYSGPRSIQADGAEIQNPSLTLYVEITGPRDHLDRFCRTHADLLQDKVLIYKHMEHWEIGPHEVQAHEADPAEYRIADEDVESAFREDGVS